MEVAEAACDEHGGGGVVVEVVAWDKHVGEVAAVVAAWGEHGDNEVVVVVAARQAGYMR